MDCPSHRGADTSTSSDGLVLTAEADGRCPLWVKSGHWRDTERPRAEAIQEVGFTRKLKPYFSKIDFAVCVRKNNKYCTASDLAFAVNAMRAQFHRTLSTVLYFARAL